MKGRKPKYSNELIAELAARVAAGESPSLLAKEKGMSRSSVRRCAASARLPAEVKEQGAETAIQVGTARQREKLFWRFIEAYLRQGIALAPSSTPRDVASMLEAVVRLRALLPPPRAVARLPEIRKTEETLMLFRRSLSQAAQSPKIVDAAAEAAKDLEAAERAALETASDEGAAGNPATASEGEDATN